MRATQQALTEPELPRQLASNDRLPLHARVREDLRALAMDTFEDGQKFFSEIALMQRFGVSQGTVRHALADLAGEGLLVRTPPQGTFVHKPAASRFTVSVFVPQYESPFLMAMLDQFSQQCRDANLAMKAHHTQRGEAVTEALLGLLGKPAEERVVLLAEPPRTARRLCAVLAKRGYSVVNVDTLLPGCGDAYVGVDNDAGMRLGMEHLTQLGHRRICLLVNESTEVESIRARKRAFETAAREAGLSEARVAVCGTRLWENSADAAGGKMAEILAQTPRPTAIFTVSDAGAWAVLQQLAERGIRVPDDMSVLGFDDDRASRFMRPTLSSLAQPIEAITQGALKLLSGPRPRGRISFLAPRLVVRQSTGRALREGGVVR